MRYWKIEGAWYVALDLRLWEFGVEIGLGKYASFSIYLGPIAMGWERTMKVPTTYQIYINECVDAWRNKS
jgi:hypothetical protein